MKQLDVAELSKGDRIHVLAGEGSHANEYDFLVQKPGEYPDCYLVHRPSYDDVRLGPVEVSLEGCLEGEHEVDLALTEETYQKLEDDIQPGDGLLRIGGIMVISSVEARSGNSSTRRPVLPPIVAISLRHPS